MENKTRYITPFVMLLAASAATIVMCIRKVDLMPMFKTLVIVLIIFYIIGDIVRYIYASIRPKVIPDLNLEKLNHFKGSKNTIGHSTMGVEDEALDDRIDEEQLSMDDLFDSDTFEDEPYNGGDLDPSGFDPDSFNSDTNIETGDVYGMSGYNMGAYSNTSDMDSTSFTSGTDFEGEKQAYDESDLNMDVEEKYDEN